MNTQCPVVLVGLPGTGKSKAGRLFAERLCVDHIDTDALIAGRGGRPIADIFTTNGEAAFRVIETETVADALIYDAIVSLGGGTAATPTARELLSGRTVVYIDAPHGEFVRRTASKTHRLLLAEGPSDMLTRLHTEREPHYRSVATIVVESGAGPVDDVVATIAQRLGRA